jgi:hypothetical protein
MLTSQLPHIPADSFPREGSYGVTLAGQHVVLTVERRPSNVGGSRLWLLCNCGRGVQKLYLYRGCLYCRNCLRLSYPSQAIDGFDRMERRLYELRKLLRCGARRPQGMHRKTFRRIKSMIEETQDRQDLYWFQRVRGLLGKGLNKR